jgi:hypothetical protein
VRFPQKYPHLWKTFVIAEQDCEEGGGYINTLILGIQDFFLKFFTALNFPHEMS